MAKRNRRDPGGTGAAQLRRARLAPALISTPGHRVSRRRQRGPCQPGRYSCSSRPVRGDDVLRSSICGTPRSSGAAISPLSPPGSPSRLRDRRRGSPRARQTRRCSRQPGDRGFESISLQRRVTNEPSRCQARLCMAGARRARLLAYSDKIAHPGRPLWRGGGDNC